jgi:hypothetical protein
MKRTIRIVLAVFLIIVLYVVWINIGVFLFGWRYGGGAIPLMIFIAMAYYVWKTIVKKNDEK